ncbi:MAG: DNA cytosine methyltransferase [Cyanobacteria bacterium P01_H01_bin.150]
MQVVELFAGGGGVACGIKEVSSNAEVWAVEFDPNNPKLSEKIADNYHKNFPQHHLIRKSVQQCQQEKWAEFPAHPDLLWASTVCCNFSIAKSKKIETTNDFDMAISTMGAVFHLQPKHFVLENVPGYKNSNTFKFLICQNLKVMGYKFEWSICKVSSIQKRYRIILRASKTEKLLEEVSLEPVVNWWNVIKDIPKEKSDKEPMDVELPTWKFRIGRRCKPVTSDCSFPTIIKSYFMDGKGANRNKFADIFLPDGTVNLANMEMVKRLSEFPLWYQLSRTTAVDGAILGNAVPPIFVSKLLQGF